MNRFSLLWFMRAAFPKCYCIPHNYPAEYPPPPFSVVQGWRRIDSGNHKANRKCQENFWTWNWVRLLHAFRHSKHVHSPEHWKRKRMFPVYGRAWIDIWFPSNLNGLHPDRTGQHPVQKFFKSFMINVSQFLCPCQIQFSVGIIDVLDTEESFCLCNPQQRLCCP